MIKNINGTVNYNLQFAEAISLFRTVTLCCMCQQLIQFLLYADIWCSSIRQQTNLQCLLDLYSQFFCMVHTRRVWHRLAADVSMPSINDAFAVGPYVAFHVRLISPVILQPCSQLNIIQNGAKLCRRLWWTKSTPSPPDDDEGDNDNRIILRRIYTRRGFQDNVADGYQSIRLQERGISGGSLWQHHLLKPALWWQSWPDIKTRAIISRRR